LNLLEPRSGLGRVQQLLWEETARDRPLLTANPESLLIGVNIGLIAVINGGWIDNVLMRSRTSSWDFPSCPSFIVVLSLTGRAVDDHSGSGHHHVASRESHPLPGASLRERSFVMLPGPGRAASSHLVEIAPNIFPIAIVNVVSPGMGHHQEASIGFLGFGDPNVLSWGLSFMRPCLWMSTRPGWVIPAALHHDPVTAVYFMAVPMKELINPRLKEVISKEIDHALLNIEKI